MSLRDHNNISEVNSISVSGHEMIIYPRSALHDVLLRKKHQRSIKTCFFHYKASAIRRRLAAASTTTVAKSEELVNAFPRNRHRGGSGGDSARDVKAQGRGDCIRSVGRSKAKPVHHEQASEAEAAEFHLSVQVRSVQQRPVQQHFVCSRHNMSTALSHATRETVQATGAPERLRVVASIATTTGADKKLLFSTQRQCKGDEENIGSVEAGAIQNINNNNNTQQQCYLNSTYDYLYQRHVDTLNRVICESAPQIENVQDRKQQPQSKVNKSGERPNLGSPVYQQIRISVSSSEDTADEAESVHTSLDASSLETDSERRSPPAASDCCGDQLSAALEAVNIDPCKPRIVLQQETATDPQLLSSEKRRSRSPSPLLEVPIESVDISREIRRPPIQ